MKLKQGDKVPEFNIQDITGKTLNNQYFKKKRLLLVFQRFAGCPVCNFHVHELLKHTEQFKKQNVEVVLVYESSTEILQQYLRDTSYPYHFVADPANILYNLFSVKKSWTGILSSLFHGVMKKALRGQKLFQSKIKHDGSMNRMEAEFLIDENGSISIAHYSTYLGDQLPVEMILKSC